ncbi:hypothetical protein FQZ97_968420 [compost metagenome]
MGLRLAVGAVLARHGEFEHHRGGGQQRQGMDRHQGEQCHQAFLAIRQLHQRDADHHQVGEHTAQRQHNAAPVEPAPGDRGAQQTECGQEIGGQRPQVQRFDVHGAHGAKQQRRDQQQEHEVGEVLDRLVAYPVQPSGEEAGGNQQEDGSEGGDDGVGSKVHQAMVSPGRPAVRRGVIRGAD